MMINVWNDEVLFYSFLNATLFVCVTKPRLNSTLPPGGMTRVFVYNGWWSNIFSLFYCMSREFLFFFIFRHLSSNQLKQLPKINPATSLRFLSVSNNRITRTSNQFKPFQQIKSINLSSNRITDLKLTDFPSSTEALDFSDNRIQRLIPNSFKLPNLRKLLLSRNRIKSLRSDIFSENAPFPNHFSPKI